MAAARFCSECGARLKIRRNSILPFPSCCSACSPRYHLLYLMLVLLPLLSAALGFAIGHYTSTPEPFYFIGTPVDISSNHAAFVAGVDGSASGTTTSKRPDEPVISISARTETCGARTKSGKPCRRKVKGGGHCWQHRDAAAN